MELTSAQQRRIGRQSIDRDIERWQDRARAQFMALCDARPQDVPMLAERVNGGRIDGRFTWNETESCGCIIGTLAYDGVNDVRQVYGDANRLRAALNHDTGSLECLLYTVMPGDTPDAHPVLALLSAWLDDWMKKNPNGCAP